MTQRLFHRFPTFPTFQTETTANYHQEQFYNNGNILVRNGVEYEIQTHTPNQANGSSLDIPQLTRYAVKPGDTKYTAYAVVQPRSSM